MAVPPRPGSDLPFDSELRDEPRVPKPLPDQGGPSRTLVLAIVAAAVIAVVLVVLL